MEEIIKNISKYNFNSENHVIEILASKLGLNKATVKKKFNSYKESNQIKFEGTKIIILDKSWEDNPFNQLPKYWAATSLHPDLSLRLKQRDYEILRFIDNGLKIMADKSFYMMAETISKEMKEKYSTYEVRTSLHKMQYWFGEDFYKKPKVSERHKRTYWQSRSYTITPPKKSERRQLIENKLKEVLGENYKYETPYLIDDYALKQLETVNNNRRINHLRRYDIKEFGKVLMDIEMRKTLLHQCKEVVMKISENFKKYYNRIMNHFENDFIQENKAHQIIMLFENSKEDLGILYETLKKRKWRLSLLEWNSLYKEYVSSFRMQLNKSKVFDY